ncbi:precorrin-6A reductase [Thermosediminibacter oceani]|uniref:Precorrin-6x reductase n=1 Tax=Thermosediminibacter oceani (strain ATCC BAA-1034 / DSM 16646 / JW/IW-1228P) TaxID=555079 RepID=D9S0T5_THEOJ|nr:precorrin-6A reductase [Thermosediminibacter oceani]ADL07099.1 precorrin-6x reductase [Thermosediminibacter oceani DSM 16646]
MILVLAGTKDGRLLAEKLSSMGFEVFASVVTDYGGQLLGERVRVRIGPFGDTGLREFIARRGIRVVVDATHPFAKDISLKAIEVTRQMGVKYIRYERKESAREYYTGVIMARDFEDAAQKAAEFHTIFLTIGSRNLEKFAGLKGMGKKLVVRVLPTSEVLKKCEQLGFSPGEIIAARGPFSAEMNYLMFRDYGIDAVVSKESGPEGGVPEKLEAARRLGIPVILIQRPPLVYPVVVNNMEDLLKEMGNDDGS